MAAARDLGSRIERCAGSSPVVPIMKNLFPIVVASLVLNVGCERKADNPIKEQVQREISQEAQWAKTWPTLNFPSAKNLPSTVRREYDKFDKDTTFKTEYFDVGRCSIMFYLSVDGNVQYPPAPPRTVTIFDYQNRIYDMRFLIGDQVIDMQKESPGIYVMNTVDFLKIATAQKVECKANESQIVLSKYQQKMFYDFASVLKH